MKKTLMMWNTSFNVKWYQFNSSMVGFLISTCTLQFGLVPSFNEKVVYTLLFTDWR